MSRVGPSTWVLLELRGTGTCSQVEEPHRGHWRFLPLSQRLPRAGRPLTTLYPGLPLPRWLPSSNQTPCHSQRSFADPPPALSFPGLQMLTMAFHLQVPHPLSWFVIYFRPYLGTFLIPSLLPGRRSTPFCIPWIILAARTPELESFFQVQLQSQLSHPLRGHPSWPEILPPLCPHSTVNHLCPGLVQTEFTAHAPAAPVPTTHSRGALQGRGCSPLAPCQRTVLNSESQAVCFLWTLFSSSPLPPASRESWCGNKAVKKSHDVTRTLLVTV